MTINKMVAYDDLGVPYHYAIVRQRTGGYHVTIDGNFYTAAESRRECEDEIYDHIADNGMTYVRPF